MNRRNTKKKLNFCFKSCLAVKFYRILISEIPNIYERQRTSLNEPKTSNNQFHFTYDLQSERDKKKKTFSRHFQRVSSKFLDDVPDKFFQFFKVVTYTILLLDGSSTNQKWKGKNQHVNNCTCCFV